MPSEDSGTEEHLDLSMIAGVIASIPYDTASDRRSPILMEYLPVSTGGSAKSTRAGSSEKRKRLTHDYLEGALGSQEGSNMSMSTVAPAVDDEHDQIIPAQARRTKLTSSLLHPRDTATIPPLRIVSPRSSNIAVRILLRCEF